MDFIIGGLAGAGATIFSNPMDVVKIRMQLQGELKSKLESPRYTGVPQALYVIAKAEGITAVQKGLIPAMVFGFCMNSVRLGTYRYADNNGWTKNSDGEINIKKAVFFSSLSGYVSAITGNPASVVKTRIQSAAHPSIAVGKQHRYKGFLDGCRQVYAIEGMRGFFSGVEGACLRLAMGSAAQLPTFTYAKQECQSRGIFKSSPFFLALAASSVSGVAISLAICPMDVVMVRLFNQGPTEGAPLYNGVFDCIHKIYKLEGLRGFYKGLGPLYLRLAPHTTVSLVIWDTLNSILVKKKSTEEIK